MSGADHAFSDADRNFRWRSDLVVVPPRQRGGEAVVHDPVSGRFFRLPRSWARVLARRGPDVHDGSASSRLPVETAWEQAIRVAGLSRERIGGGAAANRRSWLAYRVKVCSADSIAGWLRTRTRWAFSSRAVKLWCTAAVVLTMLVLSRFHELTRSLNAMASLGQTQWIITPAILLFTKVAHELSHATVCKRLGAKPKSLGVIFFFGMPCPYCDVTDSWRLPRAARAAVMAAGMYAELLIASMAAVVFLLVRDAYVDAVAVQTMVLCTVTTLAFNANPLMRYDGYYLLADLCDSPNLRTETRDVATRWFDGEKLSGNDRSLIEKHPRLATAYTLCSTAYRWTLMLAIAATFLWWMESLWIRRVGWCVIATVFLHAMARRCQRSFASRRRHTVSADTTGVAVRDDDPAGVKERRRVTRRRVRRTLGGSAAAALLVGTLWPISLPIRLRGHVDISGAASVFIPDDGVVDTVHHPWGSWVDSGEVLAEVIDIEASQRLQRLADQHRQSQLQVQLAAERSVLDDDSVDIHESRLQQLRTIGIQLERGIERMQRRQLRAPAAGRLIFRADRGDVGHDQTWSGANNEHVGGTVAANSLGDSSIENGVMPMLSRRDAWLSGGEIWAVVARPEHLTFKAEVSAEVAGELPPGTPIDVLIDGQVRRVRVRSVGRQFRTGQVAEMSTDQTPLSTVPIIASLSDARESKAAAVLSGSPWYAAVGTPVQGLAWGRPRSLLARGYRWTKGRIFEEVTR